MSDLIISDPLAQRLRSLAESEDRSVDDVLETMLEHYPVKDKARSGLSSLQIMAAMAKEANLPFKGGDIVERSREILNTEYADYLLKRMNDDDADS